MHILGSRVDAVSPSQAEDRVLRLVRERRFAHVVTFGSEMAMLAAREAPYRAVINRADLVVPDTIGIVYAAQLLGTPMQGRVAGIDLAERLCARCARDGVKVFFVGAAPGVAAQAADALAQRYPGLQIAGTHDGYFSDAEEAGVLTAIRTSGAQIVFVALGFPRQEFWIRSHADSLGAVVCIGVGGSFDVFAGRVSRAPRILRGAGLEWLYRLAREPQRLGRQLALPQFAVSVVSQAWHARRLKRG